MSHKPPTAQIPPHVIAIVEAMGHPVDKLGTFDNPIPQKALTAEDFYFCVDHNIITDLRAPEDKQMTDLLKNENWVPARQGWQEFCTANPGLGLAGSANSFIWFNRLHGAAMIEAGVMRRAVSRKLLIDRSRFGQVAFEHLTEGAK